MSFCVVALAGFSLPSLKNSVRSAPVMRLSVFPKPDPKARCMTVEVLWHLLHLNVPRVFDMRRHRLISVLSWQFMQTTQEPSVSMFHAGTRSMTLRWLLEEGGGVA